MTLPENTIEVLDKGYVRLVDYMGNDLSVVNAARASFLKESTEMSLSDEKLLNFLIRNGHMSPFRHAFVTLEFKAPLMVARQAWKYVVGSDHTMDGWNEASGRYIQFTEGYVPEYFRSAPENKKQGSGDPVDDNINLLFNIKLINEYDRSFENYQHAIDSGVCVEQARLFLLGNGVYTVWRWSTSIQGICHFLAQRLEDDAQKEIQEYAIAVKQLIEPYFSKTLEAFQKARD